VDTNNSFSRNKAARAQSCSRTFIWCRGKKNSGVTPPYSRMSLWLARKQQQDKKKERKKERKKGKIRKNKERKKKERKRKNKEIKKINK
jgi:hypothetical protein